MTKIKRQNKKILVNLVVANKILFFFLLVGFIYYITGTNDLAVKGFELQELKKQVAEIDNNNKELELKVMSLSSYNKLTEKVQGLSMVPAGSISYVAKTNEAVAKK